MCWGDKLRRWQSYVAHRRCGYSSVNIICDGGRKHRTKKAWNRRYNDIPASQADSTPTSMLFIRVYCLYAASIHRVQFVQFQVNNLTQGPVQVLELNRLVFIEKVWAYLLWQKRPPRCACTSAKNRFLLQILPAEQQSPGIIFCLKWDKWAFMAAAQLRVPPHSPCFFFFYWWRCISWSDYAQAGPLKRTCLCFYVGEITPPQELSCACLQLAHFSSMMYSPLLFL